MLIEFSVANYLSIKDRQTLRMDAANITEYQDRLIDAGRYKLLRSAVIYGANASGKSNVLKAMATMRQIITTSASQSSTAPIPVEPFLLSTETEHAPSYFEMLFLLDGVRYRYGFEADRQRVYAEWLFEAKKQQEKPLFTREGDDIEVSKAFKEGKGLEERTRDNALFLAVCDQFNGEVARGVVSWINSWNNASGISHELEREMSLRLLEWPILKRGIFDVLNRLNLGFDNIKQVKEYMLQKETKFMSAEEMEDFLNKDHKTILLQSTHKKFDRYNNFVEEVYFDFEKNESAGTNKVLDMIGPFFAGLLQGELMIVDELDAKMHPLLTKELVSLYNNPEKFFPNPDRIPFSAQLIFATHDTNLLSYGQFRRDQIYFTEKDQYGATSLYSLVEYKEEDGTAVRKDRSFEKDYIQGRYGAIPYIGDFSKLFA
jgi:uncharacterized protein